MPLIAEKRKWRAADAHQRLSTELCASGLFQLAVVVAVVAVRMMQVTADQIIRMIAVRDSFVATTGTMLMPGFMIAAGMIRGACIGVTVGYLHRMVVIMSFMRTVHVPVVQVIGMVAVFYRGMAATGTMDVVMFTVMMFVFFSHCSFSWLSSRRYLFA